LSAGLIGESDLKKGDLHSKDKYIMDKQEKLLPGLITAFIIIFSGLIWSGAETGALWKVVGETWTHALVLCITPVLLIGVILYWIRIFIKKLYHKD